MQGAEEEGEEGPTGLGSTPDSLAEKLLMLRVREADRNNVLYNK